MTGFDTSPILLEDEDAERERLAAEAFEHIRRGHHFAGWRVIAAGFDVGRRAAMRQAGTTQPKGRGYNEAFSRWLHDLCRSHWTLGIDKVTRSQLLWLHDNLAEIEHWRESLASDKRVNWNHPSAIKRHFERQKRRLDTKPRPRGQGDRHARPEFEPPHPVYVLHHLAERWAPPEIERLDLSDNEVNVLAEDAPRLLPALVSVCEIYGIETGLRAPEPAPAALPAPAGPLLAVTEAAAAALAAGCSVDAIVTSAVKGARPDFELPPSSVIKYRFVPADEPEHARKSGASPVTCAEQQEAVSEQHADQEDDLRRRLADRLQDYMGDSGLAAVAAKIGIGTGTMKSFLAGNRVYAKTTAAIEKYLNEE